jgi:2,3,4,5-tetrahydropyridine-2-carboxylate N-succinyltransferase
MSSLYSVGIGIGSKNSKGQWLEVLYPMPLIDINSNLSSIIRSIFLANSSDNEPTIDQLSAFRSALTENQFTALAHLVTRLIDSNKPIVVVVLSDDVAPATVPQAYLKLQLLSHRLVRPHQTNLAGVFGVLKNIAWTNQGPVDIEELTDRITSSKLAGVPLSVNSVDKFPKMVDYIVPNGVRIADTSRVRLGAYVGEGTTIMHEGFVNFNAGTEGPNMVEGRISAGVFCNSGTDIGGGASIMGTLSGGGTEIISLGKKCLLGANSGVGISLGDRCTVEAGLYITAGTIVSILDDKKQVTNKSKARDLSGHPDLLFRRNSNTGAVECLTNKSAVELNSALHGD